LVEVAESVYQRPRAAFYKLRSLVLTLVFAAAVGAPRAEGLVRLDPADLGRLIGLARAPGVKTVRRRLGELADAGRSDQLIAGLAARHVAVNGEAMELFDVDGHVRAYHGGQPVPKHHVARMRMAMPAEEDVWLNDARRRAVGVASPTGRVACRRAAHRHRPQPRQAARPSSRGRRRDRDRRGPSPLRP
jgi:hypothetical protein